MRNLAGRETPETCHPPARAWGAAPPPRASHLEGAQPRVTVDSSGVTTDGSGARGRPFAGPRFSRCLTRWWETFGRSRKGVRRRLAVHPAGCPPPRTMPWCAWEPHAGSRRARLGNQPGSFLGRGCTGRTRALCTSVGVRTVAARADRGANELGAHRR
jgi:hypothetical protein